jgi:translation initiation factor 1
MSSNKNNERQGVVYSTNSDFKYQTNKKEEVNFYPIENQDLRVLLDKKARAGKQVTLIIGFIGKSNDFEVLAKTLKSKCGVGGSTKDGEIIIQGDFRTKIVEILTKMGYKARLI